MNLNQLFPVRVVVCCLLSVLLVMSPMVCSAEEEETESVDLLIARLRVKSDESAFGGKEHQELMEQIVDFGEEATKPLLMEFKTTDNHVMRRNVIYCLNLIPSSERDQAYIDFLTVYKVHKEDDLFVTWYVTHMINELGESKSKAAITVLEAIVQDKESGGMVRAQAQVALSQINDEIKPSLDRIYLSIDPKVPVEGGQLAEPLQVMVTTLDRWYDDETTNTLHLLSAEKESYDLKRWVRDLAEDKRPDISGLSDQFVFKGTFTRYAGTWKVVVSFTGSTETVVCVSYVKGPLNALGCIAQINKVDGEWVIVDWRSVWAS